MVVVILCLQLLNPIHQKLNLLSHKALLKLCVLPLHALLQLCVLALHALLELCVLPCQALLRLLHVLHQVGKR